MSLQSTVRLWIENMNTVHHRGRKSAAEKSKANPHSFRFDLSLLLLMLAQQLHHRTAARYFLPVGKRPGLSIAMNATPSFPQVHQFPSHIIFHLISPVLKPATVA